MGDKVVKVKMLQTLSRVDGVALRAKDVCSVTEDEAERLVKGGFAEEVKDVELFDAVKAIINAGGMVQCSKKTELAEVNDQVCELLETEPVTNQVADLKSELKSAKTEITSLKKKLTKVEAELKSAEELLESASEPSTDTKTSEDSKNSK